jgi:hypothetical protein
MAAENPGIILADTFHSILNTASATNDPVATYTGRATSTPDYLHPNVPGAQRVGWAWWKAVEPFAGAAVRNASGSGDAWSATNPYGSMWDTAWPAAGGTASTGMSSAPAWAATTAYTRGAIVVTAGGNSYKCVGAGASGSASPLHTAGQCLDGSVTWEFLSTSAAAGAPVAYTAGRLLGASSTATVLTQQRTDQQPGAEAVMAITPSGENTQFRLYPTAGATFSNGNWTASDSFWIETEVDFDCQGALMYGVPDVEFRASGSAYAGTFALWAVAPTAGVQTHAIGKGMCLWRTPIVDIGGITPLTGTSLWTVDGARSGGTGAVVCKRSNTTIRKYDKTAQGALTW